MPIRPSCRSRSWAPSINGRAGQGCSEPLLHLSPRLSAEALPRRMRGDGENSQVAMGKNVIRRKSLEPRSPVEADRDGGVQSVDRALSILETLAEDDEGYR